MKLTLLLVIVVLSVALWRPGLGFKSQRPEHYRATGPAFDIREHLAGDLISEGMIYGPRGQVVSRFVADMKGTWVGSTGTLAEDFRYAGGGEQSREWRLTLGENGTFTAEADDIIGQATGEVSGATLSMRYRIRLPEEGGGHVLDVTDWLYLMENGTILNRSQMRKFGIKVAELVATMRPAGE
ncbi:MAG: Protein of unknown function (DUF3833) [Rhodobacteraceae bacterium HLUCCO07]|uniref:DUF3833 domain-containing protein n=1 Tax=Aquicoccus sp. TaxID=2055851 RepID=UPI0006DA8036|nr:MAG: Protein of unknown function (DUF3833) [Rhodobacteraceae bacterium HLUCCO07]